MNNASDPLHPLKSRLAHIEDRLQSIIEDGVAALFSGQAYQALLAERLFLAIRNSLEPSNQGSWQAQGQFAIHAHPLLAAELRNDPNLVLRLRRLLSEASQQSGFSFLDSVELSIIADPSLPQGDFTIRSPRRTAALGDTALYVRKPPAKEQAGLRLAYLILNGSQYYPINQPVFNLGRRADNHLVIEDPRVSRNHAQIRAAVDRYIIFDLNSTGGTFVNRQRIHQAALNTGDVISLAGVELIFGIEEEKEITKTQDMHLSQENPTQLPGAPDSGQDSQS